LSRFLLENLLHNIIFMTDNGSHKKAQAWAQYENFFQDQKFTAFEDIFRTHNATNIHNQSKPNKRLITANQGPNSQMMSLRFILRYVIRSF